MEKRRESFQYRRKWAIFVADKSGKAYDLSKFKCVFEIAKKDDQSPNIGRFIIYNISKEHAAALKKDFTKIVVSAGYPKNFGIIFDGNIKKYSFGKDGTDLFLGIQAGDGDKEYTYSVINKTLAAGATPESVLKELINSLGLPLQQLTKDIPKTQLPRAATFFGRPSEFLRNETKAMACTWTIQDGKVMVLKRTEVKDGTAVLLTSQTGLLSIPAENELGVTGRCLLNPKLKIGAKVKLESKYASELDGEYRLIQVKHKGDTRGGDWYTDFTALSLKKGNKSEVDKK